MRKVKMTPAVEPLCQAKEVGLGSHGYNRPFDIFEPTMDAPPQKDTKCELHTAVGLFLNIVPIFATVGDKHKQTYTKQIPEKQEFEIIIIVFKSKKPIKT